MALLALKHKKLPPSLHFEQPNEHIDFENSPLYVNTELRDWKTESAPRRAAVSSFGFSGTNAHLVLEEYQPLAVNSEQLAVNSEPQVIVLSAKDEERLREYAHKLLVYLSASAPNAVTQELDATVGTQTVQYTLREMVADILGVDMTEIESEQAFAECGLDAVQLSRLQTMVEERVGCDLPSTLLTAGASVASIAQHIASLGLVAPKGKYAPHPQTVPSLASIAYTLQVGREAMAQRLAFVTSSVTDMKQKLTAYVDNKQAGIYQGHRGANRERFDLLTEGEEAKVFIETLMYNGKLERVAQAWVSGVEIDWSLLYGEGRPRRISLPTYPFARESYWFRRHQKPESPNGAVHSVLQQAVRPVIRSGSSNKLKLKSLQPQASSLFFASRENQPGEFTTRMTLAENCLLREHIVFGHYVLPTDSLLELVYEAAIVYLQTERLDFEQLYLHKPLIGLPNTETTARVTFGEKGSVATFELSSQVAGLSQSLAKNMSGTLRIHQETLTSEHSYKQVLTDFEKKGKMTDLFSADYPLQVGDFYQSLQEVYLAGNRAVGVLKLAAAAQPTKSQFLLSPSILDSLLASVVCLAHHCATAVPELNTPDYAFIPIYIDKVHIAKPLTDEVYTSYVQLVKQEDEFMRFDVALIDHQDQVVLCLDGLDEKRITGADIEQSLAEMIQLDDLSKESKTSLHSEGIPPMKRTVEGYSVRGDGVETRTYILQTVRNFLSQTLLLPDEKIKENANFLEMGFDSILGMEFIQKVANHFEIQLKGTALYEYNTLNKLTDHITQTYPQISQLAINPNILPFRQVDIPDHEAADVRALKLKSRTARMGAYSDEPAVAAGSVEESVQILETPQPQSEISSSPKDIAIVGLACRFPEAENAASFWQQIAASRYLITDIPESRRAAWRDVADVYCQKGSFINDVDQFDPLFFNISPREAASMDPQLRKIFEVAWEAIEDSGQVIRGSHTGVYLGNCFNDYAQLLKEQGQLDDQYVGMANANSALANRISYTLDLTGPSLTVDTACSSSLVALHLGCEALCNGDIEQALVGGVNLSLHPEKYKTFCAMGALSTGGVLRPFDERADGYIPGEGIAMLVLKPLTQALVDSHHIYGIIKGTAVRHGGYSGGPTVPNVEEQTEVMRAAWHAGNIPAHTLSYYEAHGTGTRLGDPLEIQAIKKALAQGGEQTGACAHWDSQGQHRPYRGYGWVSGCDQSVVDDEASAVTSPAQTGKFK
ncbi:polyketide synthase dehydratase domain-containing protein [Chloroflexi bacterium TSY]|nr:polyketide synthase dehydratase domain-containing protein [Chloroflexi bacterium TSY]